MNVYEFMTSGSMQTQAPCTATAEEKKKCNEDKTRHFDEALCRCVNDSTAPAKFGDGDSGETSAPEDFYDGDETSAPEDFDEGETSEETA